MNKVVQHLLVRIGAALAGAALAGCLLAAPARAQADAGAQDLSAQDMGMLEITIGGTPLSGWNADAEDVGTFTPNPLAGGVQWRDRLLLNTLDNVGVNLLTGDNYRLGLRASIEADRDSAALNELPESMATDRAYGIGAFGQYSLDNWTVEASIGQEMDGDVGGFVADLGLKWGSRFAEGWLVEFGPKVSWANDDYMEGFFGVTPRQSFGTGLQLHDAAGSGLKDLTLSGSVLYSLSDNWTVGGMIGAQRLLGDAADSTLTKDEHQYFGGISFGYRF